MTIPVSQLDQVLAWLKLELESLMSQREAGIEAEILLAEALGKNRTWLKTWPDYQLSEAEQTQVAKMLKRRQTGEPLAYILGYQEFWSLKLAVNEHTLIPRPETELLVELALEKIPSEEDFKVADLGTGSGAIALSIAKERPQATVFAADFSAEALKIAEQNRQAHQLSNLKMVQNSWLDNWQYGELDLIVVNPPYVAEGDPHLDNLTFEPYSALVAPENGYGDIITIVTQAKSVLKTGGFLMFEHGFEQAKQVREILKSHGYRSVKTHKDLSEQDRVTIAQKT